MIEKNLPGLRPEPPAAAHISGRAPPSAWTPAEAQSGGGAAARAAGARAARNLALSKGGEQAGALATGPTTQQCTRKNYTVTPVYTIQRYKTSVPDFLWQK